MWREITGISNTLKIAILSLSDLPFEKIKQLSSQLNLSIADQEDANVDFFLLYNTNGLSLISNTSDIVQVNFSSEKLNYRTRTQQKELLIKACGITSTFKPTILDATAGFGIDAFMLASFGAHVTAIERSKIVFALLKDGYDRGMKNAAVKSILQNMSLVHTNSIDYLNSLKQNPDVIYLDPMFPERKKSALVKKEMRALQALLPEQNDIEKLFEFALKTASKRVVVKRPRLAPLLGDLKPTFQLTGKSCRLDVYI